MAHNGRIFVMAMCSRSVSATYSFDVKGVSSRGLWAQSVAAFVLEKGGLPHRRSSTVEEHGFRAPVAATFRRKGLSLPRSSTRWQ